jgi:hypothetical protein
MRTLPYVWPRFCKKENRGAPPARYKFLQKKQEGGSVLRMTNSLGGRLFPTCRVITEGGGVIFLDVIEGI